MERIISEHLRNKVIKSYLLLSPYLAFKLVKNEIIHGDKRYAINHSSLKITIEINYNSQRFLFLDKSKWHQFKKLKNKLTISTPDFNSRSVFNSRFFKLFYKNIEVEVGYYQNELFSYYVENGKMMNNILLTKGGKMKQLSSNNFHYIAGVNKIFFRGNRSGETINIADLIKQNRREYEIKNDDELLTVLFNFHPDESLKKYGLLINSKREGFFYDSDELGNFEISCYFNDKLHGYYFNNRTKEQGFYENGIKMGFWKEQGKINDPAKDRIFSSFPIFPL